MSPTMRQMMNEWWVAMFALAFLAATPAHAAWQTPGQPTDQMGASAAPVQTGITTTVTTTPYFAIKADDVAKEVARQLELQAVVPRAQAKLNPGSTPVLYSADHALSVSLHALQIDPDTKRWQAQAHVIGNGKTETVQPVAGTYEALVDVPVLTRQLRASDVIAATDIENRALPERQLRKDTVTDPKQLIGQSPRSQISSGRPIRTTEIASPAVVKKGDTIEMSYTTKYMSIKTNGTALEDGSLGQSIRIKNDKSEKAVSGKVTAQGKAEVNPDPS